MRRIGHTTASANPPTKSIRISIETSADIKMRYAIKLITPTINAGNTRDSANVVE